MQIWIQNAKITLWKNVGQFFWFHRFWSSGPGMQKKRSFLNISCNSKYKIYGIYINLGCRFEFTAQKLPYERISGNFPDFINFGHHAKKGHFSILAVFQNVWDLHKYGLQIWIQNAKITLWKNVGQFFLFHRFWSSGPGMQKKKDHFSILAVIQNIKYMGFT